MLIKKPGKCVFKLKLWDISVRPWDRLEALLLCPCSTYMQNVGPEILSAIVNSLTRSQIFTLLTLDLAILHSSGILCRCKIFHGVWKHLIFCAHIKNQKPSKIWYNLGLRKLNHLPVYLRFPNQVYIVSKFSATHDIILRGRAFKILNVILDYPPFNQKT